MRPEMWTEPWYCALIENARDDAGELRRIEQYLRAAAKPPVEQRKELLWLIEEYLRTAAPGRPPRSESEALLWADAARRIHDTTACDEAHEHILTFIAGPRLDSGRATQADGIAPSIAARAIVLATVTEASFLALGMQGGSRTDLAGRGGRARAGRQAARPAKRAMRVPACCHPLIRRGREEQTKRPLDDAALTVLDEAPPLDCRSRRCRSCRCRSCRCRSCRLPVPVRAGAGGCWWVSRRSLPTARPAFG